MNANIFIFVGKWFILTKDFKIFTERNLVLSFIHMGL